HDITGGKPDQSLAGLGQFHKLEKQERRFDLIVLVSMVPGWVMTTPNIPEAVYRSLHYASDPKITSEHPALLSDPARNNCRARRTGRDRQRDSHRHVDAAERPGVLARAIRARCGAALGEGSERQGRYPRPQD